MTKPGGETDRLRKLLDASSSGAALVDDEGTFAFANEAFGRLLQIRGDVDGRHPLEVMSSVDMHEIVERALSGEGHERAFSTSTHDLRASGSPLPDGGVALWVTDISTEREAERSRADFVANVSHELRTPLTAILGYLEAMRPDIDTLPEEVAKMLGVVDRNARRLRDLFEDLLRLHRIEARRSELPLALHRIRPLLDEAVLPARDQAHARDQSLDVHCGASVHGLVNAGALTAMVASLSNNASAYTPEGGRIEVRAEETSEGVQVTVRDNGIGIAPRHHERIFERFYRVDKARSRRAGGTGLGLAIVKHYALASRCRLTLESDEGEGSAFTITLPEYDADLATVS